MTKYLPYRSIVGYIIFVLIYGLFVFLLFRFVFVFVCLLYLLSIFFFYLHLCPFSLSLFHDPDEGHKEFVVEVFENQSRSFPGGDFKPADQNWSDAVTCIPLFCSICHCLKWKLINSPPKTLETIRGLDTGFRGSFSRTSVIYDLLMVFAGQQ